METHVSSTTADVLETHEVTGSHGNVEVVIAVEKVEEDIPLTADSNSQDNAQPVMEKDSAPCSQSTVADGNHKTPCKQDLAQQSTVKEFNKTAQSANKVQSNKQAMIHTSKSEAQVQDKPLVKQVGGVITVASPIEEPSAPVDVDSSSPKDVPMDDTQEVDSENDIKLNVAVEKDPSNDTSQLEMTGDASEKEHNKSISRELKSLIKSAKESKIISECTKLTSKTRKSARAALDTSNTNSSSMAEADSVLGNRRSRSNSQKSNSRSNSSEKSDRVGKRSMRSQNPEFVHKVRKFLNSVTGKFNKDGDSDASSASDEEAIPAKNKDSATDASVNITNNRSLPTEEQSPSKIGEKSNKLRSDPYCWRCHWSIDMNDGEKFPQPPLKCTVCIRAFHYRCLTGSEKNKIPYEKNWVCPECMTVLYAESSETRSFAMRKTTLGMLCELLKYALQSMTEVAGAEPFLTTVDRAMFPHYDKYVVHPMDLALMKENITERLYGSTEAFIADAQWILHNSIIFNTMQSKLTLAARALVRSCRAEMAEIEACPECYAAAHSRRRTWFTDVCSTPHLLLWAKLKGFPYWPAKAMSVSSAGLVDVRFYGAHDRAWVPARDCYLYCERDPNNFRTKRQDMVEAMQEAEQHIRNISRKYGKFAYAPYRTTFEASKLEEALKNMIPTFDGEVRSRVRERRSKTPARGNKSRSNSKGSKEDSNAGDMSEGELVDVETCRTAEYNDKTERLTPSEKTRVLTRTRARSETKGLASAVNDGSPKEIHRDGELVDVESCKTAEDTDKTERLTPSEKTRVLTRKRARSETKGLASAVNDGSPKEIHRDMSDGEHVDVETCKTAEYNDKTERLTPSEKTQVLTRKRARSETKGLASAVNDGSPKEKRRLLETPGKETAPKKNESVVSSCKEIVQKQPEPDDGASDEPIVVDSEPPASAPARTTTNKPDNSPKPNNVAVANKTPAKTDKAKTVQMDKSVSQRQRISRSNKSLNNIETIELDEVTPTTTAANKTTASTTMPASNTAKTYGNKIAPKESVTVIKPIEKKEKGAESAVLIKINEKGNKDASLTITVNAKDKLTEAATLTKITDIVKMTHNKSKAVKKEPETTTPSKDSGKEKVTSATPNKNANKVPPNNRSVGNEKANDKPTVASTTTATEKSGDGAVASSNSGRDKAKESATTNKTPSDKSADTSADTKKDVDKEKSTMGKNTVSPKPGPSKIIRPTKDRIQYEDDTILAVIARKVPKDGGTAEAADAAAASAATSPAPDAPPATRSTSTAKTKTTQITVQVNPDSNIFTPTSTDNVRNMKDAVNKLQKLKTGFDPPPNPQVGKVGVRAFARISSPPEKQTKPNDMLVEIKSEPMDFEESEPQVEKSTVLDSLRPRPPVPAVQSASLREVRISKVMPVPVVAKKTTKPADVRPRAKKTFPQPKKPDDGRAELTNKNSMVYIPIQPPISQSPVRAALKAVNSPMVTSPRTPALFPTANAKLTSMAPPLLPMAPPPPPATATATSGVAGVLASPAFPAVPTTVHTVPLITSVNGHWTFSLQPVMSVGAGDVQNSITSTTVNGVGERPTPSAPLSALPAPPAPAPAPTTSPSQPPALVPTGAPPIAPAVALVQAAAEPSSELPAPPQLQQRPVLQSPLAAGTEIGEMPAPSSAGPLTAKLNQNSIKLAEFFRNLLEDSLLQVGEPAAEVAALRLQLEQERWRFQHELNELKRTNEVALVEVRAAMDKERTRAVAEARRLAHQELEAAVKNAKSKQWCANCGLEAQFYCCWNTSYCDYPCQRAHWGHHYSHCTQQRTGSSACVAVAPPPPPPLPPLPPSAEPNSSSPPSVTAKVSSGPTRMVNSEHAQNKSPSAASASEDGSGHVGAKGAGASLQPAPTHATPLLANKQLISNEESGTKRVVSSGGFLIVGAGAGTSAEARRTPRRD